MKFDRFSKGQTFLTKPSQMKREKMLHFAEQFDPQPFHLFTEEAKKAGYDEIIASGAHTLGIVWAEWIRMGVLSECLGGLGIDHMTFHKPVYPDDEVYAVVTIAEKRELSDGMRGLLGLQFYVKNQLDQEVLQFSVKVLVRSEKLAEESRDVTIKNLKG